MRKKSVRTLGGLGMSSNELQKVMLEDVIISANTGADAIKRAPIVEEDTGIRCLRIGDVSNDKPYIEWGFTRAESSVINKFLLKKDDIMIARTGNTIGVVKYIDRDINSLYNNGLIRLRVNTNTYFPKYIFYNLASNCFKDFVYSISGGTSTQPNMKIGHVLKYEVTNFSLSEQKSISNILSPLDEKIKTNNRINKTLEEIAAAIFKHWFVDFEFPNENGEPYRSSGGEMIESELGMIPKGWRVETIGDICFANKDSLSNKDDWDIVNYLDTGNITKNSIDKIQTLYAEKDKIPSRAKRKIAPNDIVYSTVRPNQEHHGIIKEPVHNMLASTGFVVLTSKGSYSNDLIYLWLTQEEITMKLQSIAEQSTSTYPSIKPSDILSIKVLIPLEKQLKELTDIIQTQNKQIWINQKQNRKLCEIRDILLPKLMSGEIRVPVEE